MLKHPFGLALLAFLVLVPNASSASAADSPITLDPRITLNAYSALVDLQFEDTRNSLRVLAASENAKSADWRRIKGPLVTFAKSAPNSAAIWFARPNGSYFTVAAGRTDQSLKDRSYFPVLMAGREVFGDLVVSKSTGKRSAIIAVPVQIGGRTVGALGVSMSMEKVAAFVDGKIRFPKQVMFYALDSHGEIVLHRESKLLFEFAAQLGSPTLTQSVREMLAKPEGAVRYEFQGEVRTALFKKSDATGWVYALRW